MIEFERSSICRLAQLVEDTISKARIIAELRATEYGNFGDCEFVGAAVYEMRVHYGQATGCTSLAEMR